MTTTKNSSWALVTIAAMSVQACSLTPSYETPDLVAGIREYEQALEPGQLPAESLEMRSWWMRFGGDELNALVESLIKDSLTLKESRLQVQQAQESMQLAVGQRLPSVNSTGEIASNRTQQPDGSYSWSEAYSAGLLFDFNTDIFGGLRASARAAKLSAVASELSYAASLQREIALLSSNWVSAATLQRQLDLAKRSAQSFRSTYELTNERYRAGSTSASASDVQIALQNLETALVDIPQLETEFTKQLLVLDEQLARLPGETERSFEGQFITTESVDLPIGRSTGLLARRPDVAAAELRYLAALEDVGAARAALYPAMSLSASLSFRSDELDGLFDWDEYLGSLVNSLTAPIFQGGRLRAQVRLEKAKAEELANAFARIMLAATMEVELALADISGLLAQRELLTAALRTARLSNEIVQGRYRQGLASILSVLETQRSMNSAEEKLILTDQSIALAQINLYLSLGGDWGSQTSSESNTVNLINSTDY